MTIKIKWNSTEDIMEGFIKGAYVKLLGRISEIKEEIGILENKLESKKSELKAMEKSKKYLKDCIAKWKKNED